MMNSFIRKLWDQTHRLFANLSMKRKMIIVFVFLILIPMTLNSYISYRSYSELIKVNTAKFVLEISSRFLDKMDDYISDVK